MKRRAKELDGQGKAERAGFLHHDRRRLGGDIIAIFDCIMGIHRGNRAMLRGTQSQWERQWTQVVA